MEANGPTHKANGPLHEGNDPVCEGNGPAHEANGPAVKCWELNSIGAGGTSRKDWWLTPMCSFDVEQGGCRLWTWRLWSSGVGADRWTLNRLVLDFVVWVRGRVNEWRSRGIPDRT